MSILRDHIHLAKTVSVTGEKAPVFRWTTLNWEPTPVVFASINRTRQGRLKVHRIMESGNVVRLVDYRYIIVIKPELGYTLFERMNQLLSMHGEKVFLVDHYHTAPDNADHTTHVKPYYCEVSSPKAIAPQHQRLEMEVKLTDYSR